MKLYSPETGVKINVDKDQAQIMLDAGWTKTPPIVEKAGEGASSEGLSSSDGIKPSEDTQPSDDPDDTVEKSAVSKRKRIQK